MPVNKRAITRYKQLDKLLSDKYHCYDINDLTEMCNDVLAEIGQDVTRRCIEKDLHALEGEPFYAEIEKYVFNGKSCYRYKKPSFSIFKKELSDEERTLLREVLKTIGQFDGLANFEWLDELKNSLGVENSRRIISFSNNPYLQNSNLLGVLFGYISNKVVVKLSYHTFTDHSIREIFFHPYLLKQYNNRWFILGAADRDNKILTFALDRLDKIEPHPEITYKDCPDDIMERFEDIVGVTYYEDKPIEHIVFWVSESTKGYVITKPIHESQILYKDTKEQELRNKYPQFQDGKFFSIDCIPNYELMQALTAYGAELIVVSPEAICDALCERISSQFEKYNMLRTKNS